MCGKRRFHRNDYFLTLGLKDGGNFQHQKLSNKFFLAQEKYEQRQTLKNMRNSGK